MERVNGGDKPSVSEPVRQLRLPPLSLYIHIPWCVRKCPYCDFNSHQREGELPEQEYITALLRDFKQSLHYVQGRQIQTVFFGGGTPSLFSAAAYERLLAELQSMVEFAADIEITLEANPGTAERQKFADYRKLGINRLSIGIQSFNDQQLKNLGRIHVSNDNRKAVEFAYAAGFENLNLDIMYGLEKQSLASALADLQETIALAPRHISWYQLTIEPNTEFFKRPPSLPLENLLLDIQDQGLELLSASGFQRYEVSAFSRHGCQARHNVNYWQFGDYLGIGAGAHGKISMPAQQTIVRTRKKKQPTHYLADCTAVTTVVGAQDLPLEFMLNALRLQNGFKIDLFEAHTGMPFSTVAKQIKSLHAKGLLEVSEDRIRTSTKGMQFLNTVLEEFLFSTR